MFITDTALVLSRKKVGGSDVIVTLLTKGHGKVRVYANRARDAKSKLASETQPFTLGIVTYTIKKDFATLKEMSIESRFDEITGDVDKVFLGTYMLELVDLGLHEGDVIDGLFERVVYALDALSTAEHLLRFKVVYDLKMLKILGFEPMLFSCSQCGVQENLVFALSTLHGGLLCRDCFIRDRDMLKVTLEDLKWINTALKKPFKTVQTLSFNDTMISELSYWLDAFIQMHVVRKPIKSIQIVYTLNRR